MDKSILHLWHTSQQKEYGTKGFPVGYPTQLSHVQRGSWAAFILIGERKAHAKAQQDDRKRDTFVVQCDPPPVGGAVPLILMPTCNTRLQGMFTHGIALI